jgi:aminopeptidase-like protein
MKHKSPPLPPSPAYTILEKLWRLNRIFCSSDYDQSLALLSNYLPFEIHTYRSTEPYRGWVIPPKWDLVKGIIRHNGKVVFEVDHPLKIIGLSESFTGTLSLSELKKHLYYDHRHPESIPYHFRQHYRPWERSWGFCVSRYFYDCLEEGMYDVEIITQESEGYLKVAEYTKHGQTPASFVFVAHLDHPGMANDDLAGVAVAVELFQRLSQHPTKFTYRLVLVQEIIGSVFYLNHTLPHTNPVLESCFLEMLGSDTPLTLQSSRLSHSLLEKTLEEVLQQTINYRKAPFRSVICNDEGVWESHGIPMCCLTRYPYPEYHSDRDNLSIISQEALSQSVDILYATLQKLDQRTLIEKHFESVLSLAHPSYDLYIDPGQPAFNKLSAAPTSKLRNLMDEIPMLPRFSFAENIAEELQLPLDMVVEYLQGWEKKGLITLF